MSRDSTIRVRSLDVSIGQVLEQHADLLIGALGYESRSVFVPRLIGGSARRVVLPGFEANRVLAHDENCALARASGFDTPTVSDLEYGSFIQRVADDIVGSARPGWNPRIVVDISSMTRVRMARTLVGLRNALPSGSIIDLVYAPAVFSDEAGDDGPVTETGPLPHFAGWGGTPDVELGMLIGLGFESHLALGVVESHEPADVWCFIPSGVDDRYDKKVMRENKLLFEMIPNERRLVYDVMRPFAAAEAIQGILRATTGTHRMMVVPLGAKVFCLAALTVALAYEGRLNVWRVSSGLNRVPAERVAGGAVCGIRLLLDRAGSGISSSWSLPDDDDEEVSAGLVRSPSAFP